MMLLKDKYKYAKETLLYIISKMLIPILNHH